LALAAREDWRQGHLEELSLRRRLLLAVTVK
jgi:hypothetical protein